MKKAELVERLSEQTNITTYRADIVMKCLVNIIREELKDGGVIKLHKVGKLKIVDVKDQERYDPVNEKHILVKNNRRIKFTPSRVFKEEINDDKEIEYLS